ncbi:MAG: glycoside hydrolase family 88 protein [Lachnospiraceae bacterium]|nr:glycoside hydrolase family 88 protein [Lachnospiraceae bacterium]
MDKTALIETACKDLLTCGVWDGKTRLKRGIKKYILRRETTVEDLIFWPAGLLAQGLWKCRMELRETRKDWKPETGQKAWFVQETAKCREQGMENSTGQQEAKRLTDSIEEALTAYFTRWQKKGMPLYYLDDLLTGETILAALEEKWKPENGTDSGLPGQESFVGFTKKQCAAALDKLSSYAQNYPQNETGSFPYRANQKNGYVFVDGIGLACPFLYRYGMTFEKQEYMELAVRQIVNFLAYGMDTATGLPYHGYDVTDGCKYGIIGWGRAVGWLLRGMTACVQSEYGRERLMEPYTDLIDTVLAYQRRDGYFAWQLQAMDGPADTSATGMVCAALKQGIELGILTEDQYRQALQTGASAIERAVKDGRVYRCSGECLDFAQYPQRYGAYPWALGPALEVL